MLDLLLFCVPLVHVLAKKLTQPFGSPSAGWFRRVISGVTHLVTQPDLLLTVVVSNYYNALGKSNGPLNYNAKTM